MWLMWDNENPRPVAAEVGYMNETSIEDEKNVDDQMVKSLGAKKCPLKVLGYDRIFKAHRSVKAKGGGCTRPPPPLWVTALRGVAGVNRDVLRSHAPEWTVPPERPGGGLVAAPAVIPPVTPSVIRAIPPDRLVASQGNGPAAMLWSDGRERTRPPPL